MNRLHIPPILLILIFTFSLLSVVESTTFKVVNRCRHTIWPGILTGADRTVLNPTGFALNPGKSRTLRIPVAWSGRLWGRTDCRTDSTGRFSCVTADCGSGKVECEGRGAEPPATLVEFTLNGDQGLDFYDVSLVDGYNLPMLVIPRDATSGGCSSTGCLVDLNAGCPTALRVARSSRSRTVVACKSACEAFGDPRFCCSEGYNTPETCPPTEFSQYFKHVCPRSYSYAYDDKTSTFTCAGANYVIIFCPLPYTSEKLLEARNEKADLPLVNKTMMYIGRHHGGGVSG
ncbi:thaumatin-like protein 1b [Lactuca sativa]|uniref:Thaumatin-like protein n=1 Tax=Lactuca sativa TaxID=4236 RepID=A0A9R1W2T3_LACSA|nr:thaumatin-like protein 1b [Lactuca sativa]KAJ0215175.1 hypothetical protein LSAT_V11C300120080 [Lactuca sativa]